jgi:hypothetical protein
MLDYWVISGNVREDRKAVNPCFTTSAQGPCHTLNMARFELRAANIVPFAASVKKKSR